MKTFFVQATLLVATLLFLTGTSPNKYGNPAGYQHVEMPFYAETVEIDYDPAMAIANPTAY